MELKDNTWKKHNPSLTFEELVSRYINDCMQYLKVARTFKEPDITKQEFDRTKNQDLIYYGLRELKDKCMILAGQDPLDWKDKK